MSLKNFEWMKLVLFGLFTRFKIGIFNSIVLLKINGQKTLNIKMLKDLTRSNSKPKLTAATLCEWVYQNQTNTRNFGCLSDEKSVVNWTQGPSDIFRHLLNLLWFNFKNIQKNSDKKSRSGCCNYGAILANLNTNIPTYMKKVCKTIDFYLLNKINFNLLYSDNPKSLCDNSFCDINRCFTILLFHLKWFFDFFDRISKIFKTIHLKKIFSLFSTV